MAKEKSTTSEKTNIRRIKATDEAPKKTTKAAASAKAKTKAPAAKTVSTKKSKKSTKATTKPVRDINEPARNPFVALGNYFRGAWHELKQVRWPTRSATWSMTLAVLLFSALFVVIILLLDYAFNQLFEQILN